MLCRALFLAAIAVIAVSAHSEGDFDGRIIGGEEAGKNDARYIAQIFELLPGKRQVKFVGTGAFISARTVVTAASLIEKGKKYVIRYGSNNILYSGHSEIEVVNIFRAPKCDVERRVNNIALLILARPVTECAACRDIEYLEVQTLPIEDNANLQTVGFGYMNQPCYRGNKKSTVLRKTGMTLLSDHKCRKITDNASKKGRLLCTRPSNYISTVASGDEGAPLVDTTFKRLVAVMNCGDDFCDSGASVIFTAINHFVMWIKSKMVH